MKPKQFFGSIYILFLLVVGVIFFSCVNDEETFNPADKGKDVIIRFALPRQVSTPQTYAMPADESVINTIDVLSFIVDPASPNDMTKGTFFYRAPTYDLGTNSFKTTLSQYSKNQTLVILVNSRQALQNINISPGESKASVMDKLVEARSTAFDVATMTEIPMWGHIPNQTIDESYTVPQAVKLVRMLARINIVNNESDFVLKTAYLYNPREKGAYMPNNWDEANTTVINPTEPAGSMMPVGTNFMYNTTTNNFSDKIYTFEADNRGPSAASLLNSTCIIVGGDYTDATGTNTYYYRIDLKQPGTETFYNVLRNHSYNITINEIKSPGTDTPDEAYRGSTYINATVEVWEDMNSVVIVDANYHLKVSQNFIFFDRGAQTVASTENKITIQSTSNWQITSYPDWAVPNQMSGIAGSTANVSLIATSSGNTNREGTMTILSANLIYTVNVLQADCGINGFALRQKIGNNVYRTYQYGGRCWMVENSREGLSSATMFDNDLGKTNGYYYIYTQATSGACPPGWSLPNNTQWNVLRNAVLADPLVSGKWWAGQIGFFNGAYAGYYQDEGWLEWGESGVWWIQGANGPYLVSYYGNNGNFMDFPESQPSWSFSVRCIRN